MAHKLYLDPIRKRTGWTGDKLSGLMNRIIAVNQEKAFTAIGRLRATQFEKQNVRSGSTFKLPDLSEVLPKQSVFARKAAIRGRLITDNLRDSLTRDLRATLAESKWTGAKGKMNPKLIDAFRERITQSFEGYTKRDPRYGMPSNIRNIAVTEIGATINDVKKTYHDRLMQANPDMKAFKTWNHSSDRKRIKVPRRGHMRMNGVRVEASESFQVPLYDAKGRYVRTDSMDRPHDERAPLDQVIGCMCSINYSYIKAARNVHKELEDNIRVLKAAAPVGTIHQRKDGKYKKISDTEWQKIGEEKESPKQEQKQPEQEKENASEKIKQEAIKKFGLTNNIDEAGYIMDDGKLLDFSGKNQGGSSGSRALDHRDVNTMDSITQTDSATEGMVDFMNKAKAIRIDNKQGAINSIGFPNEEQMQTILRNIKNFELPIRIQIDNEKGNQIGSEEIDSDKPIDIIRAYEKLKSK